jgi:hypothetical protein
MDKTKLQYYFSSGRTKKYFERHLGDEGSAIRHYLWNIKLSEASYPVLSIVEVALRNSVNRVFINHFGKENWYDEVICYFRFSKKKYYF